MSIDIFLSYAGEDTAKATALARVLQADGWSVWWDRENSPGPDVESDSAVALTQVKAVVVLWSAFSVASSRVKNEASAAKESNKLIPVLLEEARVPLSYRSLHTIDLREWPDKKSLREIATFKSAVNRLLHSSVPDQTQKEPATSDEMTLSVRVASHMAAGKRWNEAEAVVPDASLAIERCITDIFLDILHTLPDTVEAKIDSYILQLANALRAPTVICSKVNFSRMNVSDIRSISASKITAIQEKAILEYVNQYCAPAGEHNLHLEPGKWPEGKMLCLPLSRQADGRAFAWFMAKTPTGEWTPATQEQLLKLASGLQAGLNLAS